MIRTLLLLLGLTGFGHAQVGLPLVGPGSPSGAAITVVQHKPFVDWSNFQSVWNVSFDGATQAGNTIIVLAFGVGPASIAITDNKSGGSNSYHQDQTNTLGSGLLRVFSACNAGSASQITVTFNSSSKLQAELVEVSGLSTTCANSDKTNANDNGYSFGASNLPFTSNATATTTQAKEFLFGWAINLYAGNVTWTDDSPWTLIDMTRSDGIRTAYRTVSSTGAYAYSGTYTLASSDVDIVAGIVTYKGA